MPSRLRGNTKPRGWETEILAAATVGFSLMRKGSEPSGSGPFAHSPGSLDSNQDLVSLSRRLRVSTLSTTFSTSVRKKLLLVACTTATWVPV